LAASAAAVALTLCAASMALVRFGVRQIEQLRSEHPLLGLTGVWSSVVGAIQVGALSSLAWAGERVAAAMVAALANQLRAMLALFWWALLALSSRLIVLGIGQQRTIRRARSWTIAWSGAMLIALTAMVAVVFDRIVPTVGAFERQWRFHSRGAELAVVVPLLSALALYPTALLVVSIRRRGADVR
jgi:hypothetical protein